MSVYGNDFARQANGGAVTFANSSDSGTGQTPGGTSATQVYSNSSPPVSPDELAVLLNSISGQQSRLDQANDDGASTTITDRFLMMWDSLPSGVAQTFSQYRANDGVEGQSCNVTCTTAGKMQLQNAAGTGVATEATNVFPTGVWLLYQVQATSSVAAGTIAAQCNRWDTGALVSSLSASSLATKGGRFVVTRRGKGTSNAFVGQLRLANIKTITGSLEVIGAPPTVAQFHPPQIVNFAALSVAANF